MRALRSIVFLLVAVIVVAFAIANRDSVTINFYPLPFLWQTQVFLPILGAFAIGLLLGAFYYWVAARRWRWRARSDERRIERLERRLTETKPDESRPPAAASPGRTALVAPSQAAARRHATVNDE